MSSTRLAITRILAADRETIFRAFTDPTVMTRWFFAGPDWSVDVTNDVRVGGDYQLKMTAPDGAVFPTNGSYREIDPPRRLVFTWNSSIAQDTLVTVALAIVDGGTRLTLTHDLFTTPDAPAKHRVGWTGCLDSLDRLLTPAR